MIYFDSAATLPLRKEAGEIYLSESSAHFANANSPHAFGRESARSLESARKGILRLLQLEKTHRLIFLSGATEANNLALKGVARAYRSRGKRIISSEGEHESVLEPLKALAKEGFDVVLLPLDATTGTIRLEDLREALDDRTILVSVMAVNNETGAITPLEEVRELLRGHPKCYLHSDFTQGAFKGLPYPYGTADLLSMSAHKFGGPKGAGFLALRKDIRPSPLMEGGGQEEGLRPGTSDVPSALASWKALELAKGEEKEAIARVSSIRARILGFLSSHPEDFLVNSPEDGSPFLLDFSLRHKKASVVEEALSLRGIYVSTTSACSSRRDLPSHVLLAMGRKEEEARNAIRLSFSLLNEEEDAPKFLSALEDIMKETIDSL